MESLGFKNAGPIKVLLRKQKVTAVKTLKRFFGRGGRLLGVCLLLAAGTAAGESSYDEVYIQGHRCMVIEPEGLPSNAPLLLMLHGFGSNGFEQLALYDQLSLPPCLVVLPDAPWGVHGPFSGARTWYGRFTHSFKDMEKSRLYLFEIMDHFSNEGADPPTPGTAPHPRPVIIMGFSQGAVMSLDAGLNYKGNIEAIISMSGLIEYPEKTLAHPLAPRSTPILLIQGQWDPIVESDDGETIRSLKKAGYQPVLKEFKMGHKINCDTVGAVSNFIYQKIFEQKQQSGLSPEGN